MGWLCCPTTSLVPVWLSPGREGHTPSVSCPSQPLCQWPQSCFSLPASVSGQVTVTVLPELMDKLPVGLVAAGQGAVCLAEGTAGSPRVPATGNPVQGHGDRVSVCSANPSILVPAGAWAELPGEGREDVLADVFDKGKGESCSQAGDRVQTPWGGSLSADLTHEAPSELGMGKRALESAGDVGRRGCW